MARERSAAGFWLHLLSQAAHILNWLPAPLRAEEVAGEAHQAAQAEGQQAKAPKAPGAVEVLATLERKGGWFI